MIVIVGRDGTLGLAESSNFKEFRVDAPANVDLPALVTLPDPGISFESNDVAWVTEAWLRSQSFDEAWGQRVSEMVSKARPYGWIRDYPVVAVRAHIQRLPD